MATYQFPVLVWEDMEGYFTASIVEEDDMVAVDKTPGAALSQLKGYLSWLYKREPHLYWPDFLEPRLTHLTVSVRPEYEHRSRIYPCNEVIPLRIPCVHGRQEDGLLVCSMPTLDIRFYYYEAKQLKSMAAQHVMERLKGSTPQELSRCLPPKEAILDEIAIQVSRKKRVIQDAPVFEALSSVAEALGDKSVRRQFAKPWGRDGEVEDLVGRLVREKVNVILVGESGVGKTSVLVEAARKIERTSDAPSEEDGRDEGLKRRKQHRFWLTGGSRLIAGMRYLGEWQER